MISFIIKMKCLHLFFVVRNMKLLILAVLLGITCGTPLTKKVLLPVKLPSSHEGRIIGGDIAASKQFPHQVAVYFDTSEGSFFCGGSLISDRWIVTAGHCTVDSTIFTLHLGANSLVDADPNRVTVATTFSITHEDYNNETLENDIGLIRLQTAVTLNDYIQPIELDSDEIPADVDAVVSGWGQTNDWGGGVTNDLNFVGVDTISNADCAAVYGDVADGMLCTKGRRNEGICGGDSGGPLITDEATPKQVGVASFASSRGCEYGDPSGYTRVAQYRAWITENTGI